MSECHGLVVPLDQRDVFQRISVTLEDQIGNCNWIIQSQGGPFDSRWIYESDENEQLLDRFYIDLPYYPGPVWRRGVFPLLAPQLLGGEWLTLIAFTCEEAAITSDRVRIMYPFDVCASIRSGHLDEWIDLVVLHVDGWWECYSKHSDWIEEIVNEFPMAVSRSCTQACTPLDPGR